MQDMFSIALDQLVQHLLLHGHRRHQLAAGAAHVVRQHAGDGGELADHEAACKAYCILFLLLETGMLGVFLALDFFLFYVFWEVMLLPMYFLDRRLGRPAAGIRGDQVLPLHAGRQRADADRHLDALFQQRRDAASATSRKSWSTRKVVNTSGGSQAALRADRSRTRSRKHTFNILALAQMGQLTEFAVRRRAAAGARSLQWWAFLLLFIGFAIKVPAVPLHTWLPDAHVEAPTPISMILAGVLLKMGGYGIIRICYPICPDAGYDLAWFVCGVGVVSMVYGAFAAMAQKDFKRLVAYSSVSHMGYVVLGIGVWSAMAGNSYNSDYWADGRERRHVPDDRPRHQLGRHVLYGRRDLRPRASSQPRPVRRAVRQDAGLQRAGDRHFLRRPGAAGLVRFHRRSLRHAFGLELQQDAGRDLGVGRDPHGRLHSVDDAARLSWARNTKVRTAIISRR